MFGGDSESLLQPIFTLGVGGAIGAFLVLAVGLSIGYMVYMQSRKDRSGH